MAEAAAISDAAEDKEKDEPPKARLQPPDRRKFENRLASLNAQIKNKESNYKSLGKPMRPQEKDVKGEASRDRETLLAELRGLKAKRDKMIGERKTLDVELKTVNNKVQQKNDEHSKLKANLRYKTEEKIDEVIRRLEHQMRTQQFKLSEEKKLVQEINALKRSKLIFHETSACLQSLNQLRDQQKDLRSKLNACVKNINKVKAEEEGIKVSLDELKVKADAAWTHYRELTSERDSMKKEIDDLYERKRHLVAEFKREQEAYNDEQREAREQHKLLHPETKRKEEVEHREPSPMPKNATRRYSSEHVFDVFAKEKASCAALISYLEGIHVASQDEMSQQTEAAPQKDLTESFGGKDGYIKKKGDDDLVGLFGGVQRKMSRKGSKKGRKTSVTQPRKLLHHPSVVEQFMDLKLSLPQTASDVQQALNRLRELKIHYETAQQPSYDTQDDIEETHPDSDTTDNESVSIQSSSEVPSEVEGTSCGEGEDCSESTEAETEVQMDVPQRQSDTTDNESTSIQSSSETAGEVESSFRRGEDSAKSFEAETEVQMDEPQRQSDHEKSVEEPSLKPDENDEPNQGENEHREENDDKSEGQNDTVTSDSIAGVEERNDGNFMSKKDEEKLHEEMNENDTDEDTCEKDNSNEDCTSKTDTTKEQDLNTETDSSLTEEVKESEEDSTNVVADSTQGVVEDEGMDNVKEDVEKNNLENSIKGSVDCINDQDKDNESLSMKEKELINEQILTEDSVIPDKDDEKPENKYSDLRTADCEPAQDSPALENGPSPTHSDSQFDPSLDKHTLSSNEASVTNAEGVSKASEGS